MSEAKSNFAGNDQLESGTKMMPPMLHQMAWRRRGLEGFEVARRASP